MAKRTNHTHKLKRHRYSTGNYIFFCTLEDCHYKIDAPLALGKKSICNICGEEFVMNEYSIKLLKPHCHKCGKIRVKDSDGTFRYVKKVANNVLSGLAVSATDELKERLARVTVNEVDEDI